MANDEFRLPGSSLEEIEKIIAAHARRDEPSSNAEISKLAGLAKSTISRNNKFLVTVGILEDGQKKKPTDVGQKLARALEHGRESEIQKYWRQVVTGNPFLSDQIAAVRIQKGIEADDLPDRILYNSDASKNKYTETGARAVADVLVKAGLLKAVDGAYQVARGPSPGGDKEDGAEPAPGPPTASKAEPVGTGPANDVQAGYDGRARKPFQLALNLQLQLPEFDDTSKYEDLFKALREHLLSPSDE